MTRRIVLAALFAGVLVVPGMGCSESRDATANREVSPDGRTQVQTRSRVRETPTGAVYKETETQQREVLRTREEAATTRPMR